MDSMPSICVRMHMTLLCRNADLGKHTKALSNHSKSLRHNMWQRSRILTARPTHHLKHL